MRIFPVYYLMVFVGDVVLRGTWSDRLSLLTCAFNFYHPLTALPSISAARGARRSGHAMLSRRDLLTSRGGCVS